MQKTITPKQLSIGSHIRIIAPSCSGKTIKPEQIKVAEKTLIDAGFKISFGKNVFTQNKFDSSDRALRIKDFHQAFSDPEVNGILAVRGGYNANDLLDYLDWNLIKNNPKIFCGYSDNTVLQNAIFKMTGLITYSGPNFATFGIDKGLDFTLKIFLDATTRNYTLPYDNNSNIKIINKGKTSGTIMGGNLCSLNLLQGTKFMPEIRDSIIFIEDDHISSIDLLEFHRNLQSLINLDGFDKVRALVIGKFENESNISASTIKKIIKSKPELNNIPILADVTFGHTLPMITFPIGGKAQIDTNKKAPLKISTI